MRYRLNYAQLSIGILLATAMIGRSCSAKDGPGNGQGYMPMAPAGPASPSSLNRSVVPGPPMQPARVASCVLARPSRARGIAVGSARPAVRAAGRRGSRRRDEAVRRHAHHRPRRLGSDLGERGDRRRQRDHRDEQGSHSARPVGRASRDARCRKRLKGLIETKLVYQDAKRTIPTEGWPHVEKQLTKQFEEVELDKMMKKAGVEHAPRVRPEAPHVGHVAGAREAGVHRALAGPGVGPPASQARRGNHLRPDGCLLPRPLAGVHHARPRPVGGTDGPLLQVSHEGRGLRGHRADGEPGVGRRAVCRSGQGRLRRLHGGQRRPSGLGPPRGP